MKATSTLFVLLLATCAVHSARILGIFPMPGKSHYILGSALMRALAEKGHDVTVISPFGEKHPPKNTKYRDILCPQTMIETEARKRQGLNMYEIGEMNPFINIAFLSLMISDIGEMTLNETGVQELIKSGEKFDVVIVEQFYNDAQKALAHHFQAPQIVFSTIGANAWINSLVGNPQPISYIPDTFLSYSSSMSFCERVINTFIYIFNSLIHHFYLYPKHNRVMKKYFPNAPADIDDVLYNASLVLLNSHPSLNQPVPHVPNMIEIGGFHVQPPKPLPDDLQKFLDDAKDGVIYFSMGSNLRSADLPKEKLAAFLNNFSKVKEKVLWKWEEETLPGQPSNVKLGKWLPQQDILAHPNVKLFITHGGLLSITESVYHGVPILAIPIFGDQRLNAQNAVNNGYGVTLPFRDLNEQTLNEKLNEILRNPKYANNIKFRSRIFHDRIVKPMDEAIYWVEYVIRHGGAPHLMVAGVDLPWYKYLLLDVIAFVLLATVISVYIILTLFRRICRKKSKDDVKLQRSKKNQ